MMVDFTMLLTEVVTNKPRLILQNKMRYTILEIIHWIDFNPVPNGIVISFKYPVFMIDVSQCKN